MNISKIEMLEKENIELKRQLEETLNKNDDIKQYQNYMREMDMEIAFLRKQLQTQPVTIHVNIRNKSLEKAEKFKFDLMSKHPLFIQIPVSAIRMTGMPSSYINEISPQCMNSLVYQVEADLRDRLIVLVER